MKKIKLSILIGLGIFVFGTIIMFVTLTNNMKHITAIEITDIKLVDILDGEYLGEYYYDNQIGATVLVKVKNNEITEITFIDHMTGLGSNAENIVLDVIDEQSILVDDVAGATTSSHVIKLAIKNALEVTK